MRSIVVLGAAVVAMVAGGPAPAVGALPSAAQADLASFRQFAQRESLGPSFTVSYVLSTSDAAELLLYRDIPGAGGTEPVIAMVAEGRFRADWEKAPSGFRPEPGRFLSRVAPLGPHAQWSGGMSDTDPDIAALGSVVEAG